MSHFDVVVAIIFTGWMVSGSIDELKREIARAIAQAVIDLRGPR